MIQGYAGRASVAPGEPLVLHVSTDAARFRVSFYRWGDGLVRMGESAWLAGKAAPRGGAADSWHWPAYELRLPRDWPSGAYIAHLNEPGASVLFVLRGEGRSPLLYKLPLATYQAYNRTGGGCFYVDPIRCADPPGSKVTLHRPGGGISAESVYGAADCYDLSSPRQSFAHWDAPFIRWLYRQGCAPEFCADLDLHEHPGMCVPYRLLLNVGHDEYWSEAMRDQVESFVARGGTVFTAASTDWAQVLASDAEPCIARITRNVVERLLSNREA